VERKRWLYISLFALMCMILGWWLFNAGYYFALTRAEKEKTVLLSDDIVVLKYVAEELKKKDSKRAIDILQGMIEVKGAYIRAAQQTLGELNIVNFALRPGTTIDIVFSEEPKSYRLIKGTEK
jgi:hypothetical protein